MQTAVTPDLLYFNFLLSGTVYEEAPPDLRSRPVCLSEILTCPIYDSLRLNPAIPTSPVPSRSMVVGSGLGHLPFHECHIVLKN